MSKYFDLFPKINYDIFQDGTGNTIQFTNILTRLKISDDIKNNLYSYYEYDIRDGDTIEILAEKYYGDPEYHWIIALANDMVDPLFDWPKNNMNFDNYIISKYGSIATAKTQIHHYQKEIDRTVNSQTKDAQIFEIDANTYNTIATYSYTTFNANNNTVLEEVKTSIVYCYDWEFEQNENKRHIKLIKKDYLGEILKEFSDLISTSNPVFATGLRRFNA